MIDVSYHEQVKRDGHGNVWVVIFRDGKRVWVKR